MARASTLPLGTASQGAPLRVRRRFIPWAVSVILWFPRLVLSTGDDEATVDRLFASRHVTDLRLIIAGALFAALLVLVVGAPLAALQQSVNDWADISKHVRGPHTGDWFWVKYWISVSVSFFAVFAPVLAVVSGVIAWAYQVGSARLGVVDLFACEISTLCRVAAALDSVSLRVAAFEAGPVPAAPLLQSPALAVEAAHPFTSQEDYFPVFTANSHDLQSLEASTVITITAFYTYMKSARDGLRALADIVPDKDDLAPPPATGLAPGVWRGAQRNILYMRFLAMGGGRPAVGHLVEFEPEKAERTIIVLLSELEAYRFLCGQYTDPIDPHRLRIILREADYRHVVPGLRHAVEAARRAEVIPKGATPWDQPPNISQWEPAFRLLGELTERYEAALAATTAARHDPAAGGSA